MNIAGWSSLEARRAHNPKVIGSNPIPATIGSHGVQTAMVVLYRENSRKERYDVRTDKDFFENGRGIG